MIGHVTPEAYDGGPISLVEDGDSIAINSQHRTLNLVSSLPSLSLIFLAFTCRIPSGGGSRRPGSQEGCVALPCFSCEGVAGEVSSSCLQCPHRGRDQLGGLL